MPYFKDKTTLITGASSGIGRQLALRLAEHGAKLVLTARRKEKLCALRDELQAKGAEVLICAGDVSDRVRSEEIVAEAEQAFGPIDILINNAGIGHHGLFCSQDVEEMERLFSVNVLGSLYFTRAVAPKMAARGEGAIVFMASLAGLIPVPGESLYCATKFAIVGLAESLSLELEPDGVHVLTVCPGSVRGTEFVPEDEHWKMPEAAHKTAIDPEEVVQATLKGLAARTPRVIIPRKLEVAVAARGVLPSLVRRGTQKAMAESLAAQRSRG